MKNKSNEEDEKMIEKKISLVATTFNNENEIISFLDNIFEQTLLPNEIVISDGGSKDRTVDYIKNYQQNTGVKINIRTGKRLNIAEGFNDAIKNSSGDIIFIAGVGNLYPNFFVEKLYMNMTESKADVVCPYIVAQKNNNFTECYNKVFCRNGNGQVGENAANHGCLVKREIFQKYGYFYEKFIYAGEDAEFYKYIQSQGAKIISIPEVKVYWDVPANWKQFKKQVRVYAIAHEQFLTVPQMLKENKISIVKALIVLLGILILPFSKLRIVGIVTLLLFMLKCLKSIKENRMTGFLMIMMSRYGKFYYYIVNAKYWKRQYKVKR